MKEKKNLLYIVAAIIAVLAACAIIYVFRDEIREFFEKLCSRASALKDKAAAKLAARDDDDYFEDDFADDDEDVEVEITFAKNNEAESAE